MSAEDSPSEPVRRIRPLQLCGPRENTERRDTHPDCSPQAGAEVPNPDSPAAESQASFAGFQTSERLESMAEQPSADGFGQQDSPAGDPDASGCAPHLTDGRLQ